MKEFPDLILEDVALFFADIYVQWRDVSWWVCRIHHTSAASALPSAQVDTRTFQDSTFRCVLPMGLMLGTASDFGLQSSTHSMHLANEFDARL